MSFWRKPENLVIAFNYCRHLSQNPCYILFSSQAFKFVKVTQKNIPLIKLLSNSLFLFLRQSNVTHLKFHFTKKWNCQIRETLKPSKFLCYSFWDENKKKIFHLCDFVFKFSFSFAMKSRVTSSPISKKGAQYLTSQNLSDSLRLFIARFRYSLAG